MKIAFIIVAFMFYKCHAQDPKLVTPIGHGGFLEYADFSPNGKYLTTCSWDKTCKLWDSKTGKLLNDFVGNKESINSFKFLSDGKSIITFSTESNTKIWDLQSGKVVKTINDNKSLHSCLDFSTQSNMLLTATKNNSLHLLDILNGTTKLFPDLSKADIVCGAISLDCKYVAAGFYNKYVKLFTVKTGKEHVILKGHIGVNQVKFTRDGTKIITISNTDYSIYIWDVVTGNLVHKIRPHTSLISSISFSPDSKLLVSGSWDKTASVTSLETGEQIAVLKGHVHEINYVEYSDNGKFIVTASSDNTAAVWDTENSYTQIMTARHEGSIGMSSVRTAKFSPDSKKLITSSWDKTAKVWDISTGKLLFHLTGKTKPLISASWSPDNENVLLVSDDAPARIFNKKLGIVTLVLENSEGKIKTGNYSKNGDRIIGACWDKLTRIWNANTGKIQLELIGHNSFQNSAEFSNNGKLAITTSDDKKAIIWDANNGKLLHTLTGHTNYVFYATFSPDDSRVLTTSDDMTARIWNTKTGKPEATFKTNQYGVSSAAFLQDNNVIIPVKNHSMSVWDFKRNKVLLTLKGHLRDIQNINISKNGDKIISSSLDNTFKVWNAEKGNLLFSINAHNYYVRSAYFSPYENQILSSSDDNTTKCWSAKNGNLLYTILCPDSAGYFVVTPKGFYKCSKEFSKNIHYVSKELKIITFDQLDIKYNRPDKVLEAIGSTDTALIRSYRQAYLKRIKKLGIDTSSFKEGFTIPEADFTNREQLAFEQSVRTMRVHINGNSSVNLDRFNIWVNEVPVYGQKGISLRRRLINKLDTTISITLSAGENQIETSVTDVNGIESYRQPLFVKYNPEKPVKSNTYFIGIGINRFADSKNNLSWSVKDIRDLSQYFATKGAIIDTLFDERVTRDNILSLKRRLAGTTEEDKVIIAYSGHGLLSSDFDYYLSTHTVNFSKPEENGLPYEELESLLDGIRARKKLMLIDACHSGEVDKEEITRYETATDSLQIKGTRGGKPRLTSGSSLGMKNSFELMQELFVNVGRSTGATVISAAGGTQFAQERGDLKNGVFSFVLLELLRKNKTVSISDLKNTVLKLVPELTNGLQKPTFRSETQRFDWSL